MTCSTSRSFSPDAGSTPGGSRRSIRFSTIPARPPAGWDVADFLPGATASFRDHGHLYGIPWIANSLMAGCSRYDLFEKAGQKLPDTFAEMPAR